MPLNARSLPSLPPGKHGDGNGLYLQVKGNSRSWLFRYTTPRGNERWMGLGPLSVVGLARARTAAARLAWEVRSGNDPLAPMASGAGSPAVKTVAQVVDEFEATRGKVWVPQARKDWHAFMWRYVVSQIGPMPIREVTTDVVLDLVSGRLGTSPVLDRRLQRRLSSVLSLATARGWRDGPNPARWSDHLKHLMPAGMPPVEHLPALPFSQIKEFMTALDQRRGPATAALRFIILTACRSGEARLATWAEIDWVAKTWTIPGERSKTGRTQRVPLSDAAMRCLDVAWDDGQSWLFLGQGTEPLNASSMRGLMRRMGFSAVTIHGFRSSFRDWVAETTDYPGELAEIQLGHRVYGKVEGAYRRGDQLEKRRKLMQDWAEYCNPEVHGACARLPALI